MAIMECHELGEKPLGLTASLDLTSDTSKCGEWLIQVGRGAYEHEHRGLGTGMHRHSTSTTHPITHQACESFRSDPMDIAVTIRSSIDGRYLCSSEDRKKVTPGCAP